MNPLQPFLSAITAVRSTAAAYPRRERLLGILGCLGIGILFAALRWNNYDLPLIRDEGEYAYAAQLLKVGLPAYKHSFLQKPPMIIYTYALSAAMAPKVFWAARVMAYVFVAIATLLLGLVARLEVGPGVAFPAMWLMTPMVLLPALDQFAANTEMFLLLPLMATLASFSIDRRLGGTRWLWFAGGIFGAVAVLYKYTVVPVIGLIFISWSIRVWRSNPRLSHLATRWLLALLAASITTAAVLSFFLIKGAGKELWECTILFNRLYAQSSSFRLSNIFIVLGIIGPKWWILFLLPCVLFVSPQKSDRLWLGMFLAACLGTGASIYAQYYIPVMPFWALLTGIAISRLASRAKSFVSLPYNWMNRLLTAAVVALVCLSDLPLMFQTRAEAANRTEIVMNFFSESFPIARRVAALTSPSDYVYVAGSEPQILYYAHRFSPTRFVIAYPLMIPSPLAEHFQDNLITDLQDRPPAVIVYVRTSLSWLRQWESPAKLFYYLEKTLSSDYEPVGGIVGEDESRSWQEPLPPSELAKSSVVIFKRKSSPTPSRIQ